MPFFDEFLKAARDVNSAGRPRRAGVTRVQPRDEIPVSERDLPGGGEPDGDREFGEQVSELCDLIACFAGSLPRFPRHAIPADRVRRAIHDLERILKHAEA
jgi:hypothetical protein